MRYSHSAMRQRFMKEQRRLAIQYRAAGMSEDAIRAMYEFDLAVFRSNRNNIAHKAEIEEMTSYDHATGESHYMDMDEFSAQESATDIRFAIDTWMDELEIPELYKTIVSMKPDYIEIITLMMKGFFQCDIAKKMHVDNAVICRKVKRINNILKIYLKKGNF